MTSNNPLEILIEVQQEYLGKDYVPAPDEKTDVFAMWQWAGQLEDTSIITGDNNAKAIETWLKHCLDKEPDEAEQEETCEVSYDESVQEAAGIISPCGLVFDDSDMWIPDELIPKSAKPSRYSKERMEEHDKQTKMCGSWVWFHDPDDGVEKPHINWCGNWRTIVDDAGITHAGCPACLERRAREMFDRGLNVYDEGSRVVYLSHTQATAFTKTLDGMENYFRLPGRDGMDLVFVKDTATTEGVVWHDNSVGFLLSIDWTNFADTPQGKITSGQWCSKKSTPMAEDEVVIQAHGYILPHNAKDDNTDLRREASDATLVATINLDPHTEEELQQAINIRNATFFGQLKERGLRPTVIRKSFRVKLSRIDWLLGIRQSLFRLHLNGLLTDKQFHQFLAKCDKRKAEKEAKVTT
jgi:hypothetical protein